MTAKWIWLAALTCAAAVEGAQALPDTLVAYRERYEALRDELATTRDETVAKALRIYRAELTALLANVRQQGDLDYVMAIQNELKRLEADPTAPKSPAARPWHICAGPNGGRVKPTTRPRSSTRPDSRP